MSRTPTKPRRVRLQHVPVEWPITWQIHATADWVDPITGKRETYLAGFGNEAAARAYMRLMGMQQVGD